MAIKSAIKNNPRSKAFSNLSQINHVGIIFERTNDDVAGQVAKLAKFLHDEQQVNIDVFAYVHLKKPTEELAKKKNLSLFYKKDLNWYGKPKTLEIKTFISKKFDLLIKADFSEKFPLSYICAASQAALIAGPKDGIRDYYDFIIEVDKTKPNEYHQQLIHYLTIINNSQ